MATKSSFQFIDHIIRKSFFLKKDVVDMGSLKIEIKPSGIVNVSRKEFQLFLEIILSDKVESLFINVEVIGLFKYKGKLEDIRNFLLFNAPAILFPYIRAYVSSMTALSGMDTIILPTMNLSSMVDELNSKIEIVSSNKLKS